MNCVLTQSQLDSLLRKVAKDLHSIIEEKTPFSIKSYISSVYSRVLDKTKDANLAAAYAQITPSTVAEVLFYKPEFKKALKGQISLDELDGLVDRFNENIENVNAFLGKAIQPSEVVKDIEHVEKLNEDLKTSSKTPIKVVAIKHEFSPSFYALKNSWETTSSQETYMRTPEEYAAETGSSIEEARKIYGTPDYRISEGQRAIKNPKMDLYFSFVRNILDELASNPLLQNDSRNIVKEGAKGGIYLTAMSARRLPDSHLDDNTQRWLGARAANRALHDKGVIMVVTNEDGKILYFDEKQNIVTEESGKPIYYTLREPRRSDGKIDYNKSGMRTPEQIAESLNQPIEKIEKRLKEQEEGINSVREFIAQDPEKNQVRATINGGNKGYIKIDYGSPTTLSDIQFGDSFNEIVVNKLAKSKTSGYATLSVPGISEPVPVYPKALSADDINKYVSLIVDDIYDSRGRLLTNDQKYNKLEPFIMVSDINGLGLFPKPDGTMEIKIGDRLLDTTDKLSLRKELTDFFNSSYVPKGKQKDKKKASVRKRTYNINSNYLERRDSIDDFSLTDVAGKINIKSTTVPYTDWVKSHSITFVQPNAEKKLVSVNPYFSFQFVDEDTPQGKAQEQLESEVKEEAQTTRTQDLSGPVDSEEELLKQLESLERRPKFKNFFQKESNRQATKEQIKSAKSWYESSPLAKHISFKEMFNIVNTENPDALASWTTHGITLYRGADYTDLYHEAWHGFTQMFLTKEQKQKLYDETRNLTGSFTDYAGRRVSFKYASDNQLEEWLAEDFRKYMLDEGKTKVGAPVRKSIFRRILDFLRSLFMDLTVEEVVSNEQATASIHELYEKLRIGNIHEYTFDQANRNFNTLHKTGITRIHKDEPIQNLEFGESKLIVDTIDSIIAGILRKKSLDLIDEMKRPESREIVYKLVAIRLADLRKSVAAKYEAETDPSIQASLERNLKTLDYTIRNYGDINNKGQVVKGDGVIAYHIRRSRFITHKDKYAILDAMEDEVYKADREGFKRTGNKSPLEYLASDKVVALMRSIYKKDQTNRLGAAEFEEERITWNITTKLLEGQDDSDVMYQMILKAGQDPDNTYAHVFSQLAEILGDPSVAAQEEQHDKMDLWLGFRQAFDRIRIQLIQLTINKKTLDEEGQDATPFYEIFTGETSGRDKEITRFWSDNFKTTAKSEFIENNDEVGNYLNLDKLVSSEKYSDKNGKFRDGMDFEFFNDIGLTLSKELKNVLKNEGIRGRIGAPYVFNFLKAINEHNVHTISEFKDLVREYPELGPGDEFKGWQGRLKKLSEIEAKYNPRASFMVSTAENTTQYEHAQQSSATRIISAIRKAKSLGDLFGPAGPAFIKHLDPQINPLTRGSRILESIFDPKTGEKRKNADFRYNNFSGIALTLNDTNHESGVAAADADATTKILADLFTFMQFGYSEGSRTSDRSTTFIYSPSETVAVEAGKHSGDFYIDPYKFIRITDKAGAEIENQGKRERNRIFMQYISNEALRISIMSNLPAGAPEKLIMTPKGSYAKMGSKFVIFDSVLSEDTKKAILEINNIGDINLHDFLAENNPGLYDKISNDLDAYFGRQVANFQDLVAGIGPNDAVMNPLIQRFRIINPRRDIRITDEAIVPAMFEAYKVNSWIHMYEGMALFYGDLAQYGDADNFIKRITGATSPGLGFANDKATKTYFNNLAKRGKLRPYADSIWFSGNKPDPASTNWTGILNTSIHRDVIEPSVYAPVFKKQLEDDTRTRLEKAGRLSKAEIDEIVAKEAKAYDKMNVGDGQGWISFDSYRILSKAMDEWTDDQEDLFQRVLRGDNVPVYQIMQFFPVRKYQYFGALQTSGLPATAFHKFSLVPLVPSMIKGTALEDMHNRMVEQNIDYSLFESGSKIASLTSDGKPDEFQDPATKQYAFSNPSFEFTKNKIFIEFLKDQMSVPDEYKNKVTFSTQLRKLIENGLMEAGIPTDFKTGIDINKRIAAWKDLKSEKERDEASDNYKLVKTYRNAVEALTKLKIEELKMDVGIELSPKGEYVGSMEKLLERVSQELENQDLADHEINYIQFDPKTGKIKRDLSFSPTADKIERILVAVVNKRLIRQKVNGEPLVLVSSAGFGKSRVRSLTETDVTAMIESKEITEGKKGKLIYKGVTFSNKEKLLEQLNAERGIAKFTKPTEAELAKYGTNGLGFYHPIKGRTAAMKIKIALQGDFEKLLFLKHTDGSPVRTLSRLNELLKNEEWLDTGDNRKMITLIGTRIPTQGLNSMEFMEVLEFLPKEAGSILIPPAEIVAKSGSDFDVDKLMVMMPNISRSKKEGVNLAKFSEERIRVIYNQLREHKLEINLKRDSDGRIIWEEDPESEKLVKAIFGEAYDQDLTDEEIKLSLEEEALKPYEQFRSKLVIPTAENHLLESIVSILSAPQNFTQLIRPNGTYYIKDRLADKLAKYVRTYRESPSPTQAFEVEYNLFKHQSNTIGMQALGIGAVDNSYNVLFNGVGAHMAPSFTVANRRGQSYTKPLTIHLPHNTLTVNGQKVISLSHIHDVNNEFNISDLISQLINGWVDIAKDTWIFDIQGNKETAPTFLFMLQAGVPLDTAVYLVSNPAVRRYINLQRIGRSAFGNVLGKAPVKWQFFRNKARGTMLTELRIIPQEMDYNNMKWKQVIDARLIELAKKGLLTDENLLSRIKGEGDLETGISETDEAAFLQFIELEDMAKGTTDLKMKTNFDTKKSSTLFAAQNRQVQLDVLKAGGKIPAAVVERVLNESPIGSFNIQELLSTIWAPLFQVRNNPAVNQYLLDKFKNRLNNNFNFDVENTYPDEEEFVDHFRNDIVSFIFQNTLRSFNLDKLKSYKGYTIEDETSIERVPSLGIGAFIKEGKLYVSASKIKEDYKMLTEGKLNDEYSKWSLAPVKEEMFNSLDEYSHFVIEREYIRPLTTGIETRSDYKNKLKWNLEQKKKLDNENQQDFDKRIKRLTYEEILRNIALDNTFNGWKMFKSDDSAAFELLRIKEQYPQLVKEYAVLDNLLISRTERKDDPRRTARRKLNLKNIRLLSTKLTANDLNLFHENLQTLGNSSNPKVADPAENERISNFFRRLPFVAMMQSGLDTDTIFSLGRLVPYDNFERLIEKAGKDYIKVFQNPALAKKTLDIYYDMFVNNNQIYRAAISRVRYKDYMVTPERKEELAKAPVSPTFVTQEGDFTVYNADSLSGPATAIKLAQAHPDSIFIYESKVKNPGFGITKQYPQSLLAQEEITNSVGIPLRNAYLVSNNPSDHVSDKSLDENKKRIDEVISALQEYKDAGKILVFNPNGYGQPLIGADDVTGENMNIKRALAPETFNYLSERLFSTFGYVNKNYIATKAGAAVIQASQPITDEMVRDQLNKCFA